LEIAKKELAFPPKHQHPGWLKVQEYKFAKDFGEADSDWEVKYEEIRDYTNLGALPKSVQSIFLLFSPPHPFHLASLLFSKQQG
jgi:hypothetical protein